MIRKLLLLTGLYYSILLISACCNCPPAATHRYHFSDVNGISALYIVTDSTADISVKRYTPFEKGTFGLMMRFSLEYVTLYQPAGTDLVSRAYACKCIFDQYSGLDTLQQIQIRTLKDFDATHASGADITDYFRTVRKVYGRGTEYLPIHPASMDIHENRSTGEVGFDLYLYQQPATDTVHCFEISILLHDGRTLRDTTDQVIIRH